MSQLRVGIGLGLSAALVVLLLIGSGPPQETSAADSTPHIDGTIILGVDNDGDGVTTGEGDCDDNDITIFPGVVEVVADGKDNDCDGDELCFEDADQDGFGDVGTVPSANLDCLDPGESTNNIDCDDTDSAVNPGATEVPNNGKDDDCNPATLDVPTPTPTVTPTSTATGTATPTPTPVGQTPSPTPSVTDTPTSNPTPTAAAGQQVTWADNNCKDGVNPVDSLFVLRGDAGLPTDTGVCPDMGQGIEVLNASPHIWGDVDCKDGMTPVDSLKVLRHDAGLSASQEDGRPEIGSTVTITPL